MQTAVLCYVKHNNKTLMIHRNKKKNDHFKGFWNGLGGKIEEGESPEDCVIREVQEESGLTVTKPILKGLITFPNNRNSGETWLVFMYIAAQFEGNLTQNNEGTLAWIEDDTFNDLNIQEGDRIFLPWLKDEKFFSAKFIYEGDSLLDYIVSFY